jgi:hypothetical protein
MVVQLKTEGGAGIPLPGSDPPEQVRAYSVGEQASWQLPIVPSDSSQIWKVGFAVHPGTAEGAGKLQVEGVLEHPARTPLIARKVWDSLAIAANIDVAGRLSKVADCERDPRAGWRRPRRQSPFSILAAS